MTSPDCSRQIAAFILVITGTVMAATCILVGFLAYGFASVFWMLNLRYLSVGGATEVASILLIGMMLLGAGLRLIWRRALLPIAALTGALPLLAANLCLLVIEGRGAGADIRPLIGGALALTLISVAAVSVASGRRSSGPKGSD